MSKLIDELRAEHALVAKLLGEARDAGINTPAGLATLVKAKSALLGHLKKEDVQLYPPLREAAKSNQRLSWLLNTYAKDMEGVTSAALAFFAKYEKGGEGVEFSKDFGSLFAQLKLRIGKEESELYKEYDKLPQHAAAH